MSAIRFKNDICIMRLPEEVSHEVLHEIEDVVHTSLEEIPSKSLLLSFEDVEYIDSSGIGLVIYFFDYARDLDMTYSLCHLNEYITSLFNKTRLDEVLDIYLTETEALTALAGT